MKIIVKNPGEVATVVEIQNDDQLREHVGGWLEMVHMFNRSTVPDGVVAYCDEEGKLKGLEPNLVIPGDVIVGPLVIANSNEEGETIGLDDSTIDKLLEALEIISI